MSSINNKMMSTVSDKNRNIVPYYPYPNGLFNNFNTFMNPTYPQFPPYNPVFQFDPNNVMNNLFNATNSSYFNMSIQPKFTQPTFQTNDANKQIKNEPSVMMSAPSNTDSTTQLPRKTKKKIGKPVPEEKKDQSYWDKRNKNNISAKRSRETRRNKTKEILEKSRVSNTQLKFMLARRNFLLEEERRLRMVYIERGMQNPF